MRIWNLPGLAVALMLAGCGAPEPPEANVAENAAAKVLVPAGPMLGAVDLSKPLEVTGTGASWRMTVAPGRILFRDTPQAEPIDFYPVTPQVAGDRATYPTQTPEGEQVTITLDLAPCGAAQQRLTAEVRIGARRLAGCADLAGTATGTPQRK